MKKILITALMLTLLSCDNISKETNYADHSTLNVLNKREFHGRHSSVYQLYIYDGVEAKWYDTDYDTYSKFNIKDTLTTIVLKTTKYVKDK